MVIIMFKINSFVRSIVRPLRAINIDQTPGLRFGVNRFGFLRSDRDLLLAASASNDEKQVRDIMEMAAMSGVRNPTNSGFTDAQLLDSLVPRWVQNPGDFRDFAKQLASKYPYIEKVVESVSDKSVPATSDPVKTDSDPKSD